MFGFLKSTEVREKELRDWFVEDSVRILGEAERVTCVEDVRNKRVQYLVEDIATDLLNKQRDAPMETRILGTKQSSSELAHREKGLQLLQAFLNAKRWQLERDAEGYYKIKSG